uniref:Uncharacterized protein n=1 Tax=Picea sitchensis TaxID=3332 RepID=A9NS81_PICSI|nr:unknown [Picea sitchensis]
MEGVGEQSHGSQKGCQFIFFCCCCCEPSSVENLALALST